METLGTGAGFFADFIVAGTMLADRIKGGTLVLGGVNNGNGIARVLNENGKEIVRLDKNGVYAIGSYVCESPDGGWNRRTQIEAGAIMFSPKDQSNPIFIERSGDALAVRSGGTVNDANGSHTLMRIFNNAIYFDTDLVGLGWNCREFWKSSILRWHLSGIQKWIFDRWKYFGGQFLMGWTIGNRILTQSEMEGNAQEVYSFFSGRGWTRNAIAGILGNMQTESNINPGLWQSLKEHNYSGGFGLVQWTPATNYTDWATANGYTITNPTGQLKWIDELSEIKGQWIKTSTYNMSWSGFKKSTETAEYPWPVRF